MSAEAIPRDRVVIRWAWASRWDLELSVRLIQDAAVEAGLVEQIDVAGVGTEPHELHIYGAPAAALIRGLTARRILALRMWCQIAEDAPRRPNGDIADLPHRLWARWTHLEKEIDHADALCAALGKELG